MIKSANQAPPPSDEGKLPLISIIIAVYNGAKTLQRYIDSITSQTYSNIELIIIDGASTDGTVDIIKENEEVIAYWNSEPDTGMYEALSKGFDACSGDWIHWVNADDLLTPWSCAVIVKYTKKNTEARLISGIPAWGDAEGNLVRIGRNPWYPRLFVKAGFFSGRGIGFIQQESIYFHKNLWVNLSNEQKDTFCKLRLAGDFYLWKTFAQTTKFDVIDNVIGYFCVTGQNMSHIHKDEYEMEVNSFNPKIMLGRMLKPFRVIIEMLRTIAMVLK